MLRPRLRIPRASRLWRPAPSSRSIHHVPHLDINPEDGVPGLLSPGGFDFAWTQYQQLVVERLNILTAGTDYEHEDALSILKSTAREPSQAPIFNYASMAHNNHFFFKNLSIVPDPELQEQEVPDEERIPHQLKTELSKQFSSIETLRREFLVTAMAMFGPGFVWLVKNAQSTELRILTTYLAGSPYTAAHWRRQGLDMNTQSISENSLAKSWLERSQTAAGGDVGARFVPHNKTAPGGTDVIPLLCLNTWEHVWLRDYGIGARGVGGKRQFVENWWKVINWNNVESAANINRPKPKT
ncbi:manganese and iron superoxide dismutase [Daldinia vernicosa]|uniref:manganese and iron superoxide dismutase n=1 Tax=Daldinia vernicosa TaxID=114800 RepID=UPI0020072E37|nr:manganese and iron superoxide dismutase [Daldinia vernicosa]KAI0845141.1 manganese and iron superoxide dismutase [Daldinia vernicosa]